MRFEVSNAGGVCALSVLASPDPTHPDCLDIWREASQILSQTADWAEADDQCRVARILAEACNRSAIFGRDVQAQQGIDLAKVLTQVALRVQRDRIFGRCGKIAVILFLAGSLIALVYEALEFCVDRDAMSNAEALLYDVVVINLGWFGYLLLGFWFGWLFNMVSALRNADPERLREVGAGVTNFRLALLGHVLFVGLILLGLIFFEPEIQKRVGVLDSPRFGFLLGVIAGFAEKRVKDVMGSIFNRF